MGDPDLKPASVSYAAAAYNDQQQQQQQQPPPSEGRSRRRQSMRRAGSRRTGLGIEGAAAAAAASFAVMDQSDSNEPASASMANRKKPPERKPSWMNDVPNESLSDILGTGNNDSVSAAASEEKENDGDDDDEVLVQYRLMAHHEARMRVKDNCGFDIDEYDKRRKLHPDPAKGEAEYKPRKIKPLMPEPRRVVISTRILPKPEVPATLAPSPVKFRSRGRRVPDLCVGTVVQSNGTSVTISDNDLVVRCLGCRSNLQAKKMATLVRCPTCNTVSPVSSTRR